MAAAPKLQDHFPVDVRICDLHARNLLSLLLTTESLPITALARGIDTKRNLTWTLAGFITADRDWNPKTLVVCHYGGQLTRMAEAVSVGLNLLPAGVAASSGVLVTIAAWRKLCSIIAAGQIPQAVAVTHGWLHYKALVIMSEHTFSEWVWFRNVADVNVDDIMADFLLGVASVLQGFGIETTLESPLAAPAKSVKDRNSDTITRHYGRDNLLQAKWCEGAPFGVDEDCWASYCPCPCQFALACAVWLHNNRRPLRSVAPGCCPFFVHQIMEERELTFFTSCNFPAGGYAVPEEHKNGAYFVQGRCKFFYFFCEESRCFKSCKIPGDVTMGKFQPGPCLFRGARLMPS
jgi:hypothetical protein